MQESRDLSVVCRSCGICCDGTLFGWVPAQDDPPEALVQLGLKEVREGDIRGFEQPCPRFDGECSIYESRPMGCRSFRCTLLRETMSGTYSEGQALAIIRETRALRDQVVAALAEHPAVRGRRPGVELANRLERLVPDLMKTSAALAVTDGVSLLIRLRRYFAPSRKPLDTGGADKTVPDVSIHTAERGR